jgi:hypothetical protein
VTTDMATRTAERCAKSQRDRGADGKAAAAGNTPAAARRSGDRWSVLNTFVDAVLADATEAEVRVWLVLYRDVKQGGLARVGMTDIARRAGLTRRAVVNAIAALKGRQAVEVVTRGSINGTPNAYRLHSTGG